MSDVVKLKDVVADLDFRKNIGDSHLQKNPRPHETGGIVQDWNTSARPPREYKQYEVEFFRKGRYIKVWARDEREIHGKEFLVMDHGVEGGKCVLVSASEWMPAGWQHAALALDGPDTTTSRDPCISLEYSILDKFALESRYVMLDHTYNLSFGRYHYQDLGFLEDDSLKELRLRYITYLANTWCFFDVATVLDPQLKDNKAKLKATPSVSPYDMPLESFPSGSTHIRQSTKPKEEDDDATHMADNFRPSAAKGTLIPVSVSHQNSSASKVTGHDVESNLDALPDPDAYFDTLGDLHDRLNEALQPILREPYAAHSSATAGQRRTFRKLVEYLQSIVTVMEGLVQEGFSGDIITLVIQDTSRARVLSTVGIWICDLKSLMAMLQKQLSPEPEDGSFLEIKSFCASLLRLLAIQTPTSAISEAAAAYDAIHVLCYVMAVGIISYADSHCGTDTIAAFPVELLPSDSEYCLFPGIKATDGTHLMLARCQLACLQAFTGGPIWALTSIKTHSSTARLSLSLTLDHFLDLWGPVWTVPDPDDTARVLSLHTAGGMIHMTSQPVPEDQEVVGEVHCHWTEARFSLRSSREQSISGSCLCGDFRVNTGDLLCGSFSPTARLLIGASRDESTTELLRPDSPNYPILHSVGSRVARSDPKSREDDTLPELNCYLNCKMSLHEHIRSQHHRVQAAGTSPPYWLPDTYSVGFSGGQWLNLTSTRVFKRSPGVSYKDHIVTHVATSPRSLIRLLSSRTGVEISACTLNGQRITLWRALMIIHGRWVKLHGSCDHDIGDPKCIMNCWDLPGLDTSTWDEQLAKDNSPSNWANLIKPVVSELITPLSYSGVQSDGKLNCALPENEIMTMEEPLPRWTSLLKDTCRSAAFVVLSPRCLTYECWNGADQRVLRKCQSRRSSLYRSATKPLLNTAIFVKREKFAKADLFRASMRNARDGWSYQKMCSRITARRLLEIPLEDASITIETDAEHPQLASIQRAARTSLMQAAGIRRSVYHREYLKGDHWEDDVVAVVIKG